MRFLVDAQLPPALARYLRELGHEAQHVADTGMKAATDVEIGRYATTNAATVITKDEDFVRMRALRGVGPTVIWVRIGNATTSELIGRLSRVWPDIASALERGETVIEVE